MLKVQNDFGVLKSLSTRVAVKPAKAFSFSYVEIICIISIAGVEVAEVRLSMLEDLFLKF